MHETSVAESVLQIISEAARADGFCRVRTVVLEIGQLASVEVDALRFCFDAVLRGSIADGATVEILVVPGQGWCAQCAETVPMPELMACCPQCGGTGLQPRSGQEMRLQSLVVD